MVKVAGEWLSAKGCQEVLGLLEAAGHQAYAVGGAVRNALMGREVADVDLCTSARPDQVVALAKAAGVKAIPTGIVHGTVTLLSHGEGYEVTTFRHDVETDGRHAVVSFSDNIEEDARRRDFTMNALYADRHGEVIDPLGGLCDALSGLVRFVGAPQARIREDYLRILRFFRFLAHYGDPMQGPDPEGLAACAELAEGVRSLSKERIGAELKKMLAAADPAPAMAAMVSAGVLAQLIEGADAKALAPLVHLEGDLPPRWQRRLAALGGEGLAEALRLSRSEAREVAAIRQAALEGGDWAILGYDLGEEIARDAYLLRSALLEIPLTEGWQADIRRGASAQFPVKAGDLMPAFSGPALGAKLKDLEQRWKASGLRLGKAELLAP